MITLRFFSWFRLELGLAEYSLSDDPADILTALKLCQKITGKPLLKLLLKKGELLPRTIILLNGKNINHLQSLATQLQNDDELAIFPPGGGG